MARARVGPRGSAAGASRERSRHGGDSRLRARWPFCPQIGCARFMALEPRNEPLVRRSQHGGQTRTSVLQRLGYWANRLGTLAQLARRAASRRGERGGGEGQRQQHSWDCVSSMAVFR